MEEKLLISYNDEIERQLAWIDRMYRVNDCVGPYSFPMGNTNRWVLCKNFSFPIALITTLL
jgi:hypothetical protein